MLGWAVRLKPRSRPCQIGQMHCKLAKYTAAVFTTGTHSISTGATNPAFSFAG